MSSVFWLKLLPRDILRIINDDLEFEDSLRFLVAVGWLQKSSCDSIAEKLELELKKLKEKYDLCEGLNVLYKCNSCGIEKFEWEEISHKNSGGETDLILVSKYKYCHVCSICHGHVCYGCAGVCQKCDDYYCDNCLFG